MGLRSMAVSLSTYKEPDFGVAARFAAKLVLELPNLQLPGGVCLNVNVPSLPENQIKGVLLTRQEKGVLVERYERRVDAPGRIFITGWRESTPIGIWSRAPTSGRWKTDISPLRPSINDLTITPVWKC